MEQLMTILTELRPDVDFASETALVTDSVLDSFDILSLVTELEDAFDITIRPAELIPEHFDSAAAIWEMVERLQG